MAFGQQGLGDYCDEVRLKYIMIINNYSVFQ